MSWGEGLVDNVKLSEFIEVCKIFDKLSKLTQFDSARVPDAD